MPRETLVPAGADEPSENKPTTPETPSSEAPAEQEGATKALEQARQAAGQAAVKAEIVQAPRMPGATFVTTSELAAVTGESATTAPTAPTLPEANASANQAADTLTAANATAEHLLANSPTIKPVEPKLTESPSPAPKPPVMPPAADRAQREQIAQVERAMSQPLPKPAAEKTPEQRIQNSIDYYTQYRGRLEQRLTTATDDEERTRIQRQLEINQRVLDNLTSEQKPVAVSIERTSESIPSDSSQSERPSAASLLRTSEIANPSVITVSKEQASVAPETTDTKEQFNTLQADLISVLGEQGVSVAMYRQGNEIRADYTDKDGKRIGRETIQALFQENFSMIVGLTKDLEKLALTNPELFAVRETAAERIARSSTEAADRLGKYLIKNASKLKPVGLWAQARSWYNRNKERAAGIATRLQTKIGDVQRQRSERRVAANFQRFAKNFNLMSPEAVRTNQLMVAIGQEISTRTEAYDDAQTELSLLNEKLERLRTMNDWLEQLNLISQLAARRKNLETRVNLLQNQVDKAKKAFAEADQQYKDAEQTRAEGLVAQLEKHRGQHRPAYYSQEQEMDDVLTKAAKTDPTVQRSIRDSAPIPLGPPATPNNTPPTPEAQSGEAA